MSEFFALDGVVAGYGNVPVLHGVDLTVGAGEVAVILGANGVGKTTTVRTACGLLSPWKGSIHLDGHRIDRLTPERMAREGVGVVPEPPAVFGDLSVLDNLRVGGFAHPGGRRAVQGRIEELYDAFPKLRQRSSQRAGSLSGGERRILALGRAMMGSPRILLVDEASMGLFPAMIAEVMAALAGLRDGGVTVCMVEQDVSALTIADRAYVMQKGRIVHEAVGDLRTVREQVSRAYLGASDLVDTT